MVRPRKLLVRLGVGALALGLALGLVEIGVRALWEGPQGGYPAGLFVAADGPGFRMAPGFRARHTMPAYDIEIATNAQGFRDGEIGPKTPGVRRVLALGDSFGFGHGVDAGQAYPKVVEALARDRGERLEVINAGTPGYGTAAAYELLRADGDGLDPDVVVLGLYVGNDFRDNLHDKFGKLTARAGMLVPLAPDASWGRRLSLAVLSRWRTAQFVMLSFGGSTPATPEEILAQQRKDLPWHHGFGTAMLRRSWDPDAARAFALTVGWIEKIGSWCRAGEREFLLVLLPGPMQYYDPWWEHVVKTYELDASLYDRARPNAELVRWSHEHGVRVLDLLPAFVERMREKPAELLFLDDHFNALGHRLAGERIAAALGS